tara:strand:+ start:1322 stop:1453 length:132 start_codon:yes stop_codon:yes gene_type:complete
MAKSKKKAASVASNPLDLRNINKLFLGVMIVVVIFVVAKINGI